MTDPRENCPWKCKHCLCYEGEIKRLRAVYEAAKAFADDDGCLDDECPHRTCVLNKALECAQPGQSDE